MMNDLYSSRSYFLKLIVVFLLAQMNLEGLSLCSETNNKIGVYYCYYERDDQYKENLTFFLKHGLLDHIDYFFVINGECSVSIPNKKNIFVFQRENRGYDFGAYAYLFQKFDFSHYAYHFFCNTSVRGPFLSPDTSYKNWSEPFLELLNHDVKLVGTTINVVSGNYFQYLNKKYMHLNCHAIPTVQSMMFAIDKEYFEFLNERNFFDLDKICQLSFEEVIAYQEINLSMLALENGWNIDCIASLYQGKDYRLINADFNPTSCSGDPVFPGAYFGNTLHPYDVIFFKTNRLSIPQDLLNN